MLPPSLTLQGKPLRVNPLPQGEIRMNVRMHSYELRREG